VFGLLFWVQLKVLCFCVWFGVFVRLLFVGTTEGTTVCTFHCWVVVFSVLGLGTTERYHCLYLFFFVLVPLKGTNVCTFLFVVVVCWVLLKVLLFAFSWLVLFWLFGFWGTTEGYYCLYFFMFVFVLVVVLFCGYY